MTKKLYLLISAVIFGAVSLLHLVRAAAGWTWVVGPWAIPLWLSWAAAIAAAGLAIWAWSLNRG